MNIQALFGTVKGAFLLRSDESRETWDIEGPILKGWKITAAVRTAEGRYLLAAASDVYGPAIHASTNLRDWEQVADGPSYSKESGRTLKQIWTMKAQEKVLWAGVDEAGLFRSEDDGEHWTPVEGLNDHPTRPSWFPGAGGLCAHHIVLDPHNADRLWCGISAVGVFRSDDGGQTFHPKNEGVKIIIEDEKHKDIGFCVHAIVQDPHDGNVIYRQDHRGMYRSDDAGDHWTRTETGLPSEFGFPLVMDDRTRTLFAVPLESDEYRMVMDGALRVYRSQDQGATWHSASRGLPDRNAYTSVLRQAMATDPLDPCGVYFGTTSGTIHTSRNGGDSWIQHDLIVPRVLCAEVFTDK